MSDMHYIAKKQSKTLLGIGGNLKASGVVSGVVAAAGLFATFGVQSLLEHEPGRFLLTSSKSTSSSPSSSISDPRAGGSDASLAATLVLAVSLLGFATFLSDFVVESSAFFCFFSLARTLCTVFSFQPTGLPASTRLRHTFGPSASETPLLLVALHGFPQPSSELC